MWRRHDKYLFLDLFSYQVEMLLLQVARVREDAERSSAVLAQDHGGGQRARQGGRREGMKTFQR